jgi:hypothetical protein
MTEMLIPLKHRCAPGNRASSRTRLGRATVAAAAASAASALAVLGPAAGTASAAPARSRAVEIALPANAAADPVGFLSAVSCDRAGSCAAGGGYTDNTGASQAVAVTQAGRSWRRGRELRLPSDALATSPDGRLNSLACAGPGSCVGVGSYANKVGSFIDSQAMRITESGGRWARAVAPRLPANASVHPDAELLGVSCAARGSCTAVGQYVDAGPAGEGMIVTESGGRWGRAAQVRPPANAAADPLLQLFSVTCASPGSCVAVGDYQDSSGFFQGLRVAKTRGKWRRAAEIALPANASANPDATLTSVACARTGSCEAVGSYHDQSGSSRALAVRETAGRWQQAVRIRPPGNAAANPFAELFGVSCRRPGSCVSVGSYVSRAGHEVAIRAAESKGIWARAISVPPPANAGAGADQHSILRWVTCVSARSCVAVGSYRDTSGRTEAMVTVLPAP